MAKRRKKSILVKNVPVNNLQSMEEVETHKTEKKKDIDRKIGEEQNRRRRW